MSTLKKEVRILSPKKEKRSKTLLLDFGQLTEAWRWLERQAATHGCSKTVYVKALIENDRKKGDFE